MQRWIVWFIALVFSGVAYSQPSAKTVRIGYLHGGSEMTSKPYLEAFQEGLRALGYKERQNLVLDVRYADGRFDRLPAIVQSLLNRKPDLLLAATTPGVLAAKAATTEVPIVFVSVADPLGAGVVSNLARPGRNVTGVTNLGAELAGKRLELLKEMMPRARVVAVLVNPADQNAPLQMKQVELAARHLGIELKPMAVRGAEDLQRAFAEMQKQKIEAALRLVDPLNSALRKQTATLGAQYRVAVSYAFREDVAAGGLMSYGTNLADQYRQAATLGAKILRGAKAGDLPVEQPSKFEFAINRKTAQLLKLTIPQQLLVQADIVD